MKRDDIKNIIESLLFAYAQPISIEELNIIINEELSPKEIKRAMDILIEDYKENERRLLNLENKFRGSLYLLTVTY